MRASARGRAGASLSALLWAAVLAACSAEPAPVPAGPFAAWAAHVDESRIERDVRTLAAFGTRHTASATDGDARGIGAARRWLRGALERAAAASSGRMRVREQRFHAPETLRLAAGTEIVNLYAELEGTDPVARARRYVVVAHYDSRATDVADATGDAPGANDDASGVAAVLELARVFARRPTETTLVFLLVAGEEQGLIGSRHFARRAREQGWTIAGVIAKDIVGGTPRPDGGRQLGSVRVFSEGLPAAANPMDLRRVRAFGGESDSASRQLARFVRARIAEHFGDRFEARLVFRPDRLYRGGDHLPFNEIGVPSIRLTEPVENYDRQHRDVDPEAGEGDVADFVDFAYVARVARAGAIALAALAEAPAPPTGVRLQSPRPTPMTTLRWKTGPESDLAGYEVVWRDTTAADWQHARRVGMGRDETLATLPLRRDDVHLGVRAVDRQGNRSPVAYCGE